MFKGKSESSKVSIDSFFGEDVRIEGKVVSKGNLRVDGEIAGDVVVSGVMTVGKSGSIKGNIECSEVYVDGEVKGNIKGAEKTVILETGRVNGDIETVRIAIKEGGRLDGYCKMTGSAGLKEVLGTDKII